MDTSMRQAFKKLRDIYGSSVSAEKIGNGVIVYFRGYPIDAFHINEFQRNKKRFEHWIRTINAILRTGIEHTYIDEKRWAHFYKVRKRGAKIL